MTTSTLGSADLGSRFSRMTFSETVFVPALYSRYAGACGRASDGAQVMMARVFALAHQLQIFDAIVGSIMVSMMDMFGALKRTPQVLGHHKSVLFNVATFIRHRVIGSADQNVALVKNAPAFPIVVSSGQVRGAKSGGSSFGVNSRKSTFAHLRLRLRRMLPSVHAHHRSPRIIDPLHVESGNLNVKGRA